MKNLTRFLSLALICLMILASCGEKTTDTPKTTEAPNASAETTTEAVTGETKIPSALPQDYDLDGYVMTYFGAKQEPDKNNSDNGVFASEQNGDIINDAAFARDSKVMEQYNFVLKYVECSGSHPNDAAKSVILAGDHAYDVILEGAGYMPGLAAEGMLVNMEDLEYMSLDSPWWLQTVNDTLRIGGRLYSTIGSHMIRTKTFLYSVMFNYTIADDFGIEKEPLYDAVRKGTWTLDMLYDNAKKVKADLNGDGKYDHNDLWGMSGESYCAYALSYSAGVDYVKYDSDDIPYIAVNTERNIDIITKVLTMMTDPEITLVTNRITGVSDIWATRTQMLVSDQYMFFLGQPGPAAVRTMESDYGILPAPKYEESQEGYRHTTTVFNGTTMMIPVSAADPEKVGFIQEAICYESYYSFLPAFYQNFLETKYARNQESIEMLQIIHNSIYYDMSGILVMDKIGQVINNIAGAGTGVDTIASKLSANEESANATMQKTIAAILEH